MRARIDPRLTEAQRRIQILEGQLKHQTGAQPPPAPPPPAEDPYEILGFPANAKPTKEEIKRRQHELATLFHPDRGGSLRAMQRVNTAAAELLAKL
jgi:hypothetical protein